MIVVVGSINLDIVARVDRHPIGGETLMAHHHETTHGGKGANQAVAAARLGASVSFIGRVGRDAAGDELAAGLEAEGVDISLLGRTDIPSGTALIVLDAKGENTIVVAAGANGEVSIGEAERQLLMGADVVICQLEVPVPIVLEAMAAGTGAVVLNAAPATELPDDVWGTIDYLVCNEHELGLTWGEATMESVEQRGLKAVVTTLGADGARVVTPGDVGHIPAPDVDTIDTTGAGDAFCGAFAASLDRGLDVFTAAATGVHAGSMATMRVGARAGSPTRQQLERFMEGSR